MMCWEDENLCMSSHVVLHANALTLGWHSHPNFDFFGITKLGMHVQLFKSCRMTPFSFNSEGFHFPDTYGIRG